MPALNFNKVEFIKSAADKKQFIRTSSPKVVFAGRSNVGKSSVINRVLNRKNFARVGNTPGKTIHVNYFQVDGRVFFVDLPGYGFANVPKSERDRWAKLMEEYFNDPENVTLGILVVDARHKPTADDLAMVEFFKAAGHEFLVLANKMDKLKNSEIVPNLLQIRNVLKLSDDVRVIPFSAETGTGREELVSAINRV